MDLPSTHQVWISGADHVILTSDLERLMEKAALVVLERESVSLCELSIFVTDDPGIQGLNSEYRGINEPTDVLSFPLDEDPSEVPFDTLRLLGDVIISLERAQEQAEEYGHSLQRELAFLVVHGVLHLLGYDHETDAEREVMREREESALDGLGLARN